MLVSKEGIQVMGIWIETDYRMKAAVSESELVLWVGSLPDSKGCIDSRTRPLAIGMLEGIDVEPVLWRRP